MSENLLLSENEDSSPSNGDNIEDGTVYPGSEEAELDQSSGLMEESSTHDKSNDDLANPVPSDFDLEVKPPLINTETGMNDVILCGFVWCLCTQCIVLNFFLHLSYV